MRPCFSGRARRVRIPNQEHAMQLQERSRLLRRGLLVTAILASGAVDAAKLDPALASKLAGASRSTSG